MNNDKKIAINTFILYGKLVVTTILGLLTSRYILMALGASDYGLYTVIGGIVSFMNILGTTMVSTSYRFIAIELGKGEKGNPNKVYNTVLIVHIVLSIFLILIGELLGCYYIKNYLVVELGKINDSLFVLHFSLITTALSIINVPATGLTIAREDFQFTSFVEIAIAIIKLFLVLLLLVFSGNRLRLFAGIMCGLTIVQLLLYQIYCWKKDKDVIRFRINKDKSDYIAIANFTSWSFLGSIACVGNTQGAAMIVNNFFGTILNASFGLASQVSRYANVFVKGITQAAAPQIMKSYGGDDEQRAIHLVNIICRLSSLSLLILFVPIITYTNEILNIWLGTPPNYTTIFVQFLLINTFISVLGSGFDTFIQATGKIMINELSYAVVYIIQLPIIYILYRRGFPPYTNVIFLCIGSFLIRCIQLCILKRISSFPIYKFCKDTLAPVVISFFLSLVPVIIIKNIFNFNLIGHLFAILVSIIWTLIIIISVGITKTERLKIIEYIKTFLLKIF